MPEMDEAGLDRVDHLVESAHVHPLRGIGGDDCEAHSGEAELVGLVDPRHLDRLQDLLAAALRIIVEVFELAHPLEQVGEAHGERIGVGILFRQRDRDVQRVRPCHDFTSFTMLMVYLGISTVRSPSLTIAWHDSLDCGSNPQALSSMSSSCSSEGSSAPKPSRTTTWQVVHAHDFSQACSISTPFSSRLSQIETPGSASMTVPSRHSSSWGRTTIFGTDPTGSERSCRRGRA